MGHPHSGGEVIMMTNSRAIDLAEGLAEPEGTEPEQHAQIVAAWQHLVDTGLAWSLQGWFGRTAIAMIEAGVVKHAPVSKGDT